MRQQERFRHTKQAAVFDFATLATFTSFYSAKICDAILADDLLVSSPYWLIDMLRQKLLGRVTR